MREKKCQLTEMSNRIFNKAKAKEKIWFTVGDSKHKK